MTRVSRRKTLSHSEIESFLSDIDVAADLPLPPMAVETVQTEIKAQFCVPLSPPPHPAVSHVADPMRSEVQYVRDFCRATFASYRTGKPLEPTKALCDVGRSILRGSSYPILSRRLLCPENYEYPSSSLEAKKALLLSLSPMLTEAEEQRQKETAACENFTRCKSGKGKSKFSCYDYTDIDVKCQVDFAEYEKRYLLYIGQNKKTYAKDTPLSPSLNYITFQHRQRTKSERIGGGFPRRNLLSAMRAQSGSENQIPSNLSPTPRAAGKIPMKPKLEPVNLDDTTLELVQALLKPKPKMHCVAAPSALTVSAPTGETVEVACATADIPQTHTVYEHMPPPAPVALASPEAPSPRLSVCEQHTECTDITVISETSRRGREEVAVTITVISTTDEQSMTSDGITTTTMTEDQATYCAVLHASCTPPLSAGLPAEESGLMDTEDSVIMSSGGSTGESNDRKRKHRGPRARRIDRRGTLSPATLRAMLFEACEEAAIPTGASVEDHHASMQESNECPASASPASYPSMLVDSSADTGLPSGDASSCTPAVGEVLHVATPSTAASEALYRLQCPADEDLLFLDDLDRADSPQHDHEHGKKYARSGTPSALRELQTIFVPSLPEQATMDEATPEEEQVVVEEVVSVVVEVHQSVCEEEAVAEESEEEVCMEYTSMMTEVTTSYATGDDASVEVCAAEEADTSSLDQEETQGVSGDAEYFPAGTVCEPLSLSTEIWEETTVVGVEVREECPLTTAEMEVIEDFGRELDDILCDVSALGGSPSSLLRAPHSPGFAASSPLSDAQILSLSPYVPSQSSASAAEDVTETSEKIPEFTSPFAVGVAECAPVAMEEAEQQPMEEPLEEPTCPFLSAVTLLVDESNADTVGEVAITVAAERSVSHCEQPAPLLDLAETSAPSSPALLGDSEEPAVEADRSVDLSGYSDGDLSTSMDDSQILFCDRDPELEDFEMLESMVQREYTSGELDLEFSLPAVARGEEDDTSSRLDVVEMTSKPTAEVAPSTADGKASARGASSSAEVRRSGVSSIPRFSYSPSAAKAATPSASALSTSPLRWSPRSGAPSSSQKLQQSPQVCAARSPSHHPAPAEEKGHQLSEVWPEPQDMVSVRASAQARYEEKLKVARWQCEWEVVSAQAANSALIRLNRN